jgi:signal transduction histidine kinase
MRLYLQQKDEINRLHQVALQQVVKGQRKQNQPTPPFEQILNLMPGGIVISDRVGELIWCNREAADMIGITLDDLTGRSIMSVLSKLPMLISDNLGGVETAPAEFDLHDRKIQGVMYVLYGDDGLDQGTVAILNDITSWHTALSVKQKQLDLISHELRQRLTSMGSYTKLLEDNTSQQGKTWLPRLHENVGRVTELIDTIMQVTAVKNEGDQTKSVSVYVPTVVRDTLRFLKPELDECKIYIKLDVDMQMRPIMSQRVHIQTIVKELLTNSIRFNRPGGMVRIMAGIQKEDDTNQEFLILQIIDDGQGISVEDQKKIFDVFYRPEADTQLQHRNIGVGLAIVQAIVQAYEGRIWFSSQLGKGTTFTILLPAGHINDKSLIDTDPSYSLEEQSKFDWIDSI